MLPICLTLNKFNSTASGSIEYEDEVGICISIYLDFIWLLHGSSIDNFVIALSETLSHETLHDLFRDEGVNVIFHHEMIDVLHKGLFLCDMRENWQKLYSERKEKINKEVSVAYV